MEQRVGSIELVSAVQDRATSEDPKDVINERSYIFEPSAVAVATHLELSMTQIAISQMILSSKLAQFASRFKAMTASHERSESEKQAIRQEYNRSKRAVKDERLKEIINSMKHIQIGATP